MKFHWKVSLIIFVFIFLGLTFSGILSKFVVTKEYNQKEINISDLEFNKLFSTVWTRISDSVYTYSAYLDLRQSKSKMIMTSSDALIPIRIFGLWKLPSREYLQKNPIAWFRIKNEAEIPKNQYYCTAFYGKYFNQSIESIKMTRLIFEEGLKVFAGTMYNCYFNKSDVYNIGNVNLMVAIFPTYISDYPEKLTPVNILSMDDNSSNKKIVVCIRPLFGPMTDIQQLAEFLAYYNIVLGVTEFNFYMFSVSPIVRRFLVVVNSWTSLTINLMEWNLPTGNWNELWDYGSLTALNDCTYRNMNKKYVIVVDIDEFIVPKNKINSTSTLMSYLDSNYRNISEFIIRNTFFCKEYCLSSSRNSIFNCLIRSKKIWNSKLRTKYIIKPRTILHLGHHKTMKFYNDIQDTTIQKSRSLYKSYTFKPDEFLLHHYRNCSSISTTYSSSSPHQSILNSNKMSDLSMLDYKASIYESDIFKLYLRM